MLYSTSQCSRARRRRCGAALVLGSLTVLALAGGGDAVLAAGWEMYPWISISAGHEDDRIVEQGTERFVVPAGSFLDLIPGVLFSRPLGERASLNLDAQLSLERFNNEENRALSGGAVNGEVLRRFGDRWRWRATAGGNYFSDSVQKTADRYRLGGEAAIGITGRAGFVEVLAGAQGRRYPNLVTLDDAGMPGTYSEIGGSVGATGALRVKRRLEFSGLTTWESIDARDPTLDATSLVAQLGVRVAVVGRLEMFASLLAQERHFGARAGGEDSDRYRQIGAGAACPLGHHFGLSARYAFARYTDPLGISDDLQRFAVTVTWWPTGRPLRSLNAAPIRPLTREENAMRVVAGVPHLFRFRAPGARSVALVGDFNGWDPQAAPMRDAGDGWWEVHLALPQGSHQYAYWVDGQMLAPPEAEVTVEDGFGGTNGLLKVEPTGL